MGIEDMTRLASAVAASKLFGMQSPEQALVLMAICQSEGKSPIQATKIYHIINGRPSMRADAMQAEFQARGGEIEFHQRDESACEATFSWGKTSVTVKWTMAMASAAGLTAKGGPWKTAPRSMLHARCVSEGVRAVMPGVVAGIYTPEEIEDIPAIEGQAAADTPRPIAPPQPPRAAIPAKAAAPAPRTPAPPPDWDPQVEFVKLAVEKGLDIMNAEGKPSGAKCREILCAIYGTTNAEMPPTKALWESALKALQVYQVPGPGPAMGNTPDSEDDLEDPFKD
jgi:hypothetical protein